MSQPTVATARPPATAGGGNILTRKIGPIPGWGWLVIIAGGVGLFIWWRDRKSSSSAASSSDQSQSTPSSATCYDANGNPVDCASPQAVGSNGTDYFESLYTQDEGISNALQTITPTINSTGTDVTQLLQDQQGESSTSTGATGTSSSPVTDLTVDVVSPTLARVSWRPPQYASKAPTATTYTIQVQPKDPAPHNIGSRTSYNVGGLKADTHYTAVVAPSGGPSTSKAFTTPKTATTKKAA